MAFPGAGILGRIFGSPKAVGQVIKAARDGIDALAYTSEEKATDAAKERAAARGMVVEWMEATKGQNLARRMLALMVVGVWLLAGLAGLAIGVGYAIKTGEWQLASGLIMEYAEGMGVEVVMIISFYFAAPHVGALIQARMQRQMRQDELKSQTGSL